MTNDLNIVPSIKLSVKQTFGIDSDLEVEAFEKKKMNMFLKLIKIINSIKIRQLQFYQAFLLTKEF